MLIVQLILTKMGILILKLQLFFTSGIVSIANLYVTTVAEMEDHLRTETVQKLLDS